MKTAVRLFALAVVVAGAVAAAAPNSAKNFVSHQSATSHFPRPLCTPSMPCN